MKMHVTHFGLLFLILLAGSYIFFLTNSNHSLQLAVGIVLTVFYVVWGLIHHSIQKDLHPKVVIEYILIGLIAIMLLLLVLHP